LIAVSILLAPIIGVGWCSDADKNGTSVCGSSQRSILGFETNMWVWLGAVMLVIIGTVIVARSTAKRLN
jgi:disulfide bond formation protein DsbB